ncbi:peroxiredoxin [Spiroplasma gladiatoris]|uniref:thioredoxin-dependent peroxiredoxin n=1 Tax=Spiroplasma gladiatoris TaxID=2143 RepID=A0A4P7AIN9_9MOLU|nr:peroxiredoxin [Spiroplasma gladiatoris]QBQ08147.1 peroxiredoxin [Spiroplasma gladiatoris]
MVLKDEIYQLDTGEQSNLSRLMGSRGLILFFYPKAGTKGCTNELLEFSKRKKDFDYLHYNIVGVSADNVEEQNQFACNYNVEFPLIADTNKDLINKLDLISPDSNSIRRCTFVVNSHLEVVNSYMDVDPKKHVKEVLKYLQKKVEK